VGCPDLFWHSISLDGRDIRLSYETSCEGPSKKPPLFTLSHRSQRGGITARRSPEVKVTFVTPNAHKTLMER
jgi:hypothetical protein